MCVSGDRRSANKAVRDHLLEALHRSIHFRSGGDVVLNFIDKRRKRDSTRIGCCIFAVRNQQDSGSDPAGEAQMTSRTYFCNFVDMLKPPMHQLEFDDLHAAHFRNYLLCRSDQKPHAHGPSRRFCSLQIIRMSKNLV